MNISDLIKAALEDVANVFGIKENLYDKYVEKDLLCDFSVIDICNTREQKNQNWSTEFPLGGAGTVLNAFVLYCLMRHYDFNLALETGTSAGFYTAFLIMAASRSNQSPTGVLSIDISDNEKELAKLVVEDIKARIDHFNILVGKSSLEVLPNVSRDFQMYCHDSLHTKEHMLKELEEFKKCALDRFIVYVDDQASEGFWDECLEKKLFDKDGYNIKYISGKESRLQGHLGGFVLYEKVK